MKDFELHLISQTPTDIIVDVDNPKTGAAGRFRFNKPGNILTVYFEQGKPMFDISVFQMTDLCLYVERNAHWIYKTLQ